MRSQVSRELLLARLNETRQQRSSFKKAADGINEGRLA
jgi:hypothetical protein